MEKVLKNSKAITLIALVITIIVLLILAGVTISTLAGENGLLNRAKIAGEKTKYVSAKEIVTLKKAEAMAEAVPKNGNCDLSNIAQIVVDSSDTTLEKYYSEPKTANTNDVMPDVETNTICGIVISADEYPQYKFLIGEKLDIEKVLLKDVFSKEDTTINDFQEISEFEIEKFGLTIESNTEEEIQYTVDLKNKWNLGTANEMFETYQGTPEYLGKTEGLYMNNSILATKENYQLNSTYTILIETKNIQNNGAGFMVGFGTGESGIGGNFLGICQWQFESQNYWAMSGAGDYYTVSFDKNLYTKDVWHLLGIKYDGSTFSYYVDNKKIGTSGVSSIKNSKLYIGGISNSGTSSAGCYWGYGNGYYRNLAIFDGALTDQEMEEFSF